MQNEEKRLVEFSKDEIIHYSIADTVIGFIAGYSAAIITMLMLMQSEKVQWFIERYVFLNF